MRSMPVRVQQNASYDRYSRREEQHAHVGLNVDLEVLRPAGATARNTQAQQGARAKIREAAPSALPPATAAAIRPYWRTRRSLPAPSDTRPQCLPSCRAARQQHAATFMHASSEACDDKQQHLQRRAKRIAHGREPAAADSTSIVDCSHRGSFRASHERRAVAARAFPPAPVPRYTRFPRASILNPRGASPAARRQE